MTNTVKIITDSASDLAADLAIKDKIDIVPLKIRFDVDEFTDGIELSREDFWKRIETSSELPATSAPSPGTFESAFRKAATDGYTAVVCLNISSKISGTYQIAMAAAQAAKDAIDVHVIDTEACTLAQTTLVLEAARLANNGATALEIVTIIDELKTRVHLFGALDTLENLRKGGRIGAANAFFGSLLSIKPIVGLVNGEVKAVARARTHSKAVEHLLGTLAIAGVIEQVTVGHSYAPDIEIFRQRVAAATRQSEVPVSIIGPVVGTHTGPRLLALSFVTPKLP